MYAPPTGSVQYLVRADGVRLAVLLEAQRVDGHALLLQQAIERVEGMMPRTTSYGSLGFLSTQKMSARGSHQRSGSRS